jgi:DNA-binding transcriptional ArsR family regulator
MSAVLESAPIAIRSLRAKLFRGFADPSRLAILETLRTQERCVSDLVAATGLSQPNVSAHLNCLRECGLVASRQEGRYVHYRLANAEIADILDSADAVLSHLAEQISACVNYTSDGRTPNDGGSHD